jgi:hypothetical protein
LRRKLKLPGRTVLRIESYKKKFFFFILHNLLKIYLSILLLIYQNNIKNTLIIIDITLAINREYHKNTPNTIASIKKLNPSMIFSFLDKLLKKLSCNPTFGRALNSFITGSENENKNNIIQRIAHLNILSFNTTNSLANSIVLIHSNTSIFHQTAIK